jgi:hypothetical protein
MQGLCQEYVKFLSVSDVAKVRGSYVIIDCTLTIL